MIFTLVAAIVCAAHGVNGQLFRVTNTFGRGSVFLDENQAYSWGPLSLPARVTLINMTMERSSGWVARQPAFDLYLMTKSFYETTYSTGSTLEVKPIESYLTARAATNITNIVELVIPSSASNNSQVYLTIDNRPFGGRAPEPGATVTVAWDDFQWVTGAGVTTLSGICGRRTVNTGPGQVLSYELQSTSIGYAAFAEVAASTRTAQFSAFIFNQANLDTFRSGGSYSLNASTGVVCSAGVRCTITGTGPWFFALGATGSGSVTYNYRVDEAARLADCSGTTTSTTSSTSSSSTTSSSTTSSSTTSSSTTSSSTTTSSTSTTLTTPTTTSGPTSSDSTTTSTVASTTESTAPTTSVDGSTTAGDGSTTTVADGSSTTTDSTTLGESTTAGNDTTTTDVGGATALVPAAATIGATLLMLAF